MGNPSARGRIISSGVVGNKCRRRETLWHEEGTTPTLPSAAALVGRAPVRPLRAPAAPRRGSGSSPPRRTDIDHAESRLEQLRKEEGEENE